MKSCGEMMFKTDMFTNVNNEYEWVSEEGASIGIFSIVDFLTLTVSESETFKYATLIQNRLACRPLANNFHHLTLPQERQ